MDNLFFAALIVSGVAGYILAALDSFDITLGKLRGILALSICGGALFALGFRNWPLALGAMAASFVVLSVTHVLSTRGVVVSGRRL